MAKVETYAMARARLHRELGALKGWKVSKPDLKMLWAEPPSREYKLWFRAQAVYCGEHSLFLEIRGLSVETLISHAEHHARTP